MTLEKKKITRENVEDFESTSKTITEAGKKLRQLGFDVKQSNVTLTIEAERKHFEAIFGVELPIKEDPTTGAKYIKPNRASVIVVPKDLEEVVETIVFPEPPKLF